MDKYKEETDEVEVPSNVIQDEYSRTEKKKEIYISYVNIGLSNGIKIDHHRLTYGELVCFINKLQALCSV